MPIDAKIFDATTAASPHAQRLDALTRVNLDDMVDAWGVRGRWVLEALVRRLGSLPARRFAASILEADDCVRQVGLAAGAALGLRSLRTTLDTFGVETFPRDGPVLVTANHPGMTDTLALFASIPRANLKTLAARRPFLELLEGVSATLIWVEEDGGSNRPALRSAAEHLRSGGALLTFPAGTIEPDPAVFAGAVASLARWNSSLDLLARLVPDLQIVPALVSGVISRRAAHSRLRVLRRSRAGQDHLSAMLQLSVPALMETHARAHFGPPLPVAAVSRGAHATPVTLAVTELMRRMVEGMGDWGNGGMGEW